MPFKQIIAGIIAVFGLKAEVFAQWLKLIPEQELNVGRIEKASYVETYAVIENRGEKPLFLLRADAPRELTLRVNRKVILPGDTVHLQIQIRPRAAGQFQADIKLLTGESEEPVRYRIKATFGELLPSDLQACVRFDPKSGQSGSQGIIPLFTTHKARFSNALNGTFLKEGSVLYISKLTREKFEKTTFSGELVTEIPVGPYALVVSSPGFEPLMLEQYIGINTLPQSFALNPATAVVKKDSVTAEKPLPIESAELDRSLFKPIHAVLLIDVSGSMNENQKLESVKKAIRVLLKPLRNIDKLTVITYAGSAKVHTPTTEANQKNAIIASIDSLKAGGLTEGGRALQMAYEQAAKSYITGGHNQIVLATDGIFRYSKKDRQLIEENATSEAPVFFSALSLGEDLKAREMLKSMSQLGKGRLLLPEDERVLLEELKAAARK